MRTPAGLSIRKLEWPRKVTDTAPSGTPPARCSSPSRPATTPVHVACAADAISEAMIAAQPKSHAYFLDRGREGLCPPRPPNRACGSPAHGSPVVGFLIGSVSLAHRPCEG